MKTSPNLYYLCLSGFSFICCFYYSVPSFLEVVIVSFLSGPLFFSPAPLICSLERQICLIFPSKMTIWGLFFGLVTVDVAHLIFDVLRLVFLLVLLNLVVILLFLLICLLVHHIFLRFHYHHY